MKPKIKKEVRDLIIEENETEETKMLTNISFEPWGEDWIDDPKENEMWENFYKAQKHV